MEARLSRKAQERADELSAQMDALVRRIASRRAGERGAEFADEKDINKAWESCLLEAALMLTELK